MKDSDLSSAKVVRIPLKTLATAAAAALASPSPSPSSPSAISGGDQAQWEEEKSVKDGGYTLLNPLYARAGSFLAELADYFLRVEDMSYIHFSFLLYFCLMFYVLCFLLSLKLYFYMYTYPDVD